ncbi:MAG: SH3 domain-containing protein [Pseudomonadota bacterium]
MKSLIAAACGAALAGAAWAASVQEVGPETNRPLPRFVSLKAPKANIRRGPGLTYRIDWVFLRRGMPLEIVAEHGHWRKVRDVDDAGGWVHHALLQGARTAVVTAPRAAMRTSPGLDKDMIAIAEAGVIVGVERCGVNWCEVEKDDHEGWVLKEEIWGAREDEIFD